MSLHWRVNIHLTQFYGFQTNEVYFNPVELQFNDSFIQIFEILYGILDIRHFTVLLDAPL